jgi:hypothetical protein
MGSKSSTTARDDIRQHAQAGGWTLSIEADTDAFRRDGLWTIVRYSTRGTITKGITAEKHVLNADATVWTSTAGKRARVLAWFDRPAVSVELESPEAPGADGQSVTVSPAASDADRSSSPAVGALDPARTVKVEFQVTDGYSTYVDAVDVPVNVVDYRAWIAAAEGTRQDETVTIREAEIDMDEVARLVNDVCGVPAYVEMTGGNTATIYAGKSRTEEGWGERYAAIAGPGCYAWASAESSLGAASDFYVGPDDDGSAMIQSVAAMGAFSAAEIAALIVAQATRTEVASALTADEVEALGFDPTGRGDRDSEIETPITYAVRVLRAIRADAEAGVIPVSVATFSALHDHVDANDYLINVGVPWPGDTVLTTLVTNFVTDIVDRAIKAGGLVGPVALDSVSGVGVTVGAMPGESLSPAADAMDTSSRIGAACPTCGQSVTR